MNYYIGIDIGTSSTKSVLFDSLGKSISSFSSEYDIISKSIGYAEENPLDWFNATILTLQKISKVEINGKIKGIGLSGQMHGLVLLDKEDNLLRNSIIWCDNRTNNEVELINKVIGVEKIKQITGNIALSAFTLAKLLWVKNNEPDIYLKISKVMLPKDYIRYMLTKNFVSEYSDTSGMQILDLNTKKYSQEILDKFDIPLSFFPKLIESVEISGFLTEEIQKITGLEEVFVVGGAGDQAAGAIGNNVITSGDVSITLGSSGVVFAPTKNLVISKNGEFQTFFHAIENTFHIMGVTNAAGTSLKWCHNNLYNKEKTYEEIMCLCEDIVPGSNGVFYLPYLMGERTPHLDPFASGCFFGLRNTTNKEILSRAIIEGVAYSIKECYELIELEKEKVYISGGGAKSSLWRTIISSMIDNDLIQIYEDEGPALGVAILAMVAGKEYKDISSACSKIIKISKKTTKNTEFERYYKEGYLIYKELYSANKNIFKRIFDLNNILGNDK